MFNKTAWKIESSAGAGVSLAMGVGVGAEAGTITLKSPRDEITLQLMGAGGLIGVGASSKGVSPASGPDAGFALDSLPSLNSYIYSVGSQSPKMYGEEFGGYAIIGKLAASAYATGEVAAIMFTKRSLTSFKWEDVKAIGLLSGLTVAFGAGATASLFQFSVSVSGISVFRTDQRAIDRCNALRRANPNHFSGSQDACTFGGKAKGHESKEIKRFRSFADMRAQEAARR